MLGAALVAASLVPIALPGPTEAAILGTKIQLQSDPVDRIVSQLPLVGGQTLPTTGELSGTVDDVTNALPVVGGDSLAGGNDGTSSGTGSGSGGGGGGETRSNPGGSQSPRGGTVSTAPANGSPASPATGHTRSAQRRRGARRGSRAGGATSAAADSLLGPTGGNADPSPTSESRRGSIVEKIVNRIPPEYRIALIVLAALTLLFASTSLRERRRSRRATRDSLSDALTGLANRKAFDLRLDREWKRAVRYDRPLGVVVIDLDDFKQINDTQGHAAGDDVLRRAANAIAGRGIRESDLAARTGGDEFVVLCPETGAGDMVTVADSLARSLEHVAVDASIGFAGRQASDENRADLLDRADAAMYEAKRGDATGADPIPERGELALASSPLEPAA